MIAWCTSVAISTRAAASDAPGFRRPMKSSQFELRRPSLGSPGFTWACIDKGIQTSVAFPTTSPVKPGGPTPMILKTAPFKRTARPTIPGSRAKRRSQ